MQWAASVHDRDEAIPRTQRSPTPGIAVYVSFPKGVLKESRCPDAAFAGVQIHREVKCVELVPAPVKGFHLWDYASANQCKVVTFERSPNFS